MAGKEMVRVLYDYSYTPKDSAAPLKFKRGDDYVLYKKTNAEWWSVYKAGSKPVFVPANYVEVIDKKTKKKVPPKPPKVPPKPPKPLEPDAVLKDLDDMLDTVIASDPLFDDALAKDDKDTISLKDDKSDNASLTTSTPDEDVSTSTGNLSSKDDKVCSSTDSLDVPNKKPGGSTSSVEMIYANSQVFGKQDLMPKSTASLDRNTLAKPGSDANHNRSASISVPVSIKENGETAVKKPPRPQPRTVDINYTEEPMYANLQELHARVPPPRPPLPKQLQTGKKAKEEEADDDDDDIPDYANLSDIHASMPPNHPPPAKPPPGVSPLKGIDADWSMYGDSDSGRAYFYNAKTGESSWCHPGSEVESRDDTNISSSPSLLNASSMSSSQMSKRMNSFGTATMLEGFGANNQESGTKGSAPPGWTQHQAEDGEVFFTNELTDEKWFSSKDETGQVYYYKHGASDSSWDLPEINPLKPGSLEKVLSEEDRYRLNHPKTRASWSPGDYSAAKKVGIPVPKNLSPGAVREEEEETEAPSEVFDYSAQATEAGDPAAHPVRMSTIPPHTRPPHQHHQRGHGSMIVLPHLDLHTDSTLLNRSNTERTFTRRRAIREMQAYLNKTKVAEGGKKMKKNWSQSYVITTGPFMYFYKDHKTAQPKPNMPIGRPEVQVELRGAGVKNPAPKDLSSKRNVILISTVNGSQWLLQSDDKSRIQDWNNTLVSNIALMGGYETTGSRDTIHVCRENPPSSPNMQNKGAKSRKPTKKSSTLERPTTPDDTLTGTEKNTKIKDWLLYWLLRRPTAESLKEKGIIKDGIFGSHLQSICDREKVLVPRFVINCIHAVDTRGLDVDGVYRISGNMANIQKLRFQVDQNEMYDLMNTELDIHDITGALKLFFRELQEPLFPFHVYDRFTKASQILNRPLKLKAFQDSVKELPKVNLVCMGHVIGHLRKVMDHSKQNRMEAQNVAIVFGPTLMRPQEEKGNMAANLVMQGQIIEYMLHEYKSMF